MHVNWEGILPFQGEVLVIEDDPTLRSLMVEIVEEMGAKVSAFDSADVAITHLLRANDQCCLVIVDHGVLGQIQGIEFIEMVSSRWPGIKAILTSGYLIGPEAVPAAAIYLLKPWSLDDLVIAVTSLLQPDSPIQGGFNRSSQHLDRGVYGTTRRMDAKIDGPGSDAFSTLTS
ncbi:response regulator [Pseudomonas sp. PLMAX]|uniref:response regulator n=1 Tax=Pseudomonas sp. PLMAX TaxID=2201998 RepID=UPI0038BAB661